jgi:hypothetical protein
LKSYAKVQKISQTTKQYMKKTLKIHFFNEKHHFFQKTLAYIKNFLFLQYIIKGQKNDGLKPHKVIQSIINGDTPFLSIMKFKQVSF